MSLDKLDTKSLIGLLRPAQIVTIAAFFVTLVTGAFGFGFWAGETKEAASHGITKIDLATAKTTILGLNASVDDKHKDAALMQTKIRFLDLLTRWYETRQEYEKAAASEDKQGARSASDKHGKVTQNLRNFVLKLDERSRTGDAQQAVQANLGKGIAPTLFFVRDKTTYHLPKAPFATLD